MSDTKWNRLFELTELQTEVMLFIQEWVHTENTPVPHSEVLKAMKKKGTKPPSTYNALQKLLKEHYIRKAIVISNKTYYVLLRKVS